MSTAEPAVNDHLYILGHYLKASPPQSIAAQKAMELKFEPLCNAWPRLSFGALSVVSNSGRFCCWPLHLCHLSMWYEMCYMYSPFTAYCEKEWCIRITVYRTATESLYWQCLVKESFVHMYQGYMILYLNFCSKKLHLVWGFREIT